MPFFSLDDISEREPVPGYRVRFIHTDRVTIAYWDIKAGSRLPEHGHPHEQTANVLEGRFELVVGGEAKVMGPGDVAVIPGGIPHSGRSLTDCRIVDVFSPVREDYK